MNMRINLYILNSLFLGLNLYQFLFLNMHVSLIGAVFNGVGLYFLIKTENKS